MNDFVYSEHNSERIYAETCYSGLIKSFALSDVATAMHRNDVKATIILVEANDADITPEEIREFVSKFGHKSVILIEAYCLNDKNPGLEHHLDGLTAMATHLFETIKKHTWEESVSLDEELEKLAEAFKECDFKDINKLVHYDHKLPMIYVGNKFGKRVYDIIMDEADLDLTNHVVKLDDAKTD